ncbi:MAG: RNA polymerase sigma factor [Clostridia bacterium]
MLQKRDNDEFKRIYDKFFQNIYRYAFLYTKRPADSSDIVQDVFLKFYISNKEFVDDENIKAWLLTCAYHECMDYFRSKLRKNLSLEDLKQTALPFEIDETLGEILKLPQKYKDCIYMYYYEGYSTQEIAKIINKNDATIRTRLKRGREILKKKLEEKDA